jgi:outer membrane protein OmpA-like peptidoglycan-associated protein
MPPRKPSDFADFRSRLRVDPLVRGRTVSEHDALGDSTGDPLAQVRDIRIPREGVRALGLPAAPPDAPPIAPVEEKLGWFELRVVDEQGEPVDGIEIEVSHSGSRKTCRTASNGRIRVSEVTASFGSARFADVPVLREKLRTRKIAAIDEALAKAPDVRVERVRDAMPTVALESERPVKIMLVREHVRVRLVGMFFETNKSFLLPTAMRGIRSVRRVYDRNPAAKLLAVGHADTAGDDKWNLDLSLERANAVADYLTDDVDRWLEWFEPLKNHPLKVWGVREEQLMLSALPEGAEPFFDGDATGVEDARTAAAVAKFQAWSNESRGTSLVVDGRIGPATRREIVTAYMELDRTSLPEGITLKRHGCGEFFPEEDVGDAVHLPENRRVEIFHFDGEIEPPPPGKLSHHASMEYPEWRKQVTETIDFRQGGLTVEVRDRLGAQLSGATVRLVGPTSDQGTTGNDGRIHFADVDDGDYLVEADHPAHLPGQVRCRVPQKVDEKEGFEADEAVPLGEPTTIVRLSPAVPITKAVPEIAFLNVTLPDTVSLRKSATTAKGSPAVLILKSPSSPDEDLKTNPPVVLVRGCKDIDLSAHTNPPGLPVAWSVKAHAKNTVAGTPSLTVLAGGRRARMSSNGTGAFHVTATLGASTVVWNVILVSVEVLFPSTVVTINKVVKNIVIAKQTTFQAGEDVSGKHAFEAKVKVVVTGADVGGTLGIDRVETFLLQNVTRDDLTGHYLPSGTVFEEPLASLPLPDCDPINGPFVSGSATVTNPKGKNRTLAWVDSPAGFFPTHMTIAKTAKLKSVDGGHDFKVAVISRSRDADTAMVAHAEIKWSVEFDGHVVGKSTADGTYVPDGATVTAGATYGPIGAATGGMDLGDAGYETTKPAFVGGYNLTEKP